MDPKDLPNTTKRLLVERMASYILDNPGEHDNELDLEAGRQRAYRILFDSTYTDAYMWVRSNYEEHGSGKEKA